MYYVVFTPRKVGLGHLQRSHAPKAENEHFIFEDIKEARLALKTHKGTRMKAFDDYWKAKEFQDNPSSEASFLEYSPSDTSQLDLSASLERLSIRGDSPLKSPKNPEPLDLQSTTELKLEPEASQKVEKKDEGEVETFPAAEPPVLNKLRRNIEAGKYEEVEEAIWSNPRCLVTVCDSAVYLMAGPKYNACHIAARANKPDIMALLLDTVANPNFLRKLYPGEPNHNVQERINHLLDSYLNTPDPRQGNTPLHFACKMGFYRVVRVLLTFEGCDLSLRDSNGLTAEESICSRTSSSGDGDKETQALKAKIKNMFRGQLHLPFYRDQLKKRLILARRAATESDFEDSDTSFSEESFMSVSGKSFSSPSKLELI